MAVAPRRAGRRPPTRAVAALGTKLRRAFTRTVAALEEAGLRYAVVGGVAVGIHSEPRVTRDLDFAISVTSDAEAERVVLGLQRSGFTVDSVFENDAGRLSTVRTLHRSTPGVYLDFLFFNSRIEAEIVAAATSELVAGRDSVRVVTRPHLIAMKVLAGRPKDQPDLQHLVEAATSDELGEVRVALRLMQKRGAAPGRDLSAEWKRFVQQLRSAPRERLASRRLGKLRGSRRR